MFIIKEEAEASVGIQKKEKRESDFPITSIDSSPLTFLLPYFISKKSRMCIRDLAKFGFTLYIIFLHILLAIVECVSEI